MTVKGPKCPQKCKPELPLGERGSTSPLFSLCNQLDLLTFFIWNLIVDFTSSTLATMFSLWVSKEGNLPALFRPGPRIHGICLITDSGAKKASYFLAIFLTSFLFLLSFFNTSMPMWEIIHSLGLITMLLVPQNTYGKLGTESGLKPDGAEKGLSF